MKKLAVIKNQLFKDYIKIVSTDNLEEVLDNPNIPLPFTCEFEVAVEKADELSEELKGYLNHKKVKNKDFIIWDDEVEAHLNFIFKVIKLSSGSTVVASKPVVHATKVEEVVKEEVKEPVKVEVKEVVQPVVHTTSKEEAKQAMNAVVAEEDDDDDDEAFASSPAPAPVKEKAPLEIIEEQNNNEDVILISSLNIPVNSTIQFSKKDTITAVLVDEKTVIFEDEEMPLIDATKKAFKKAGVTGLPLGLANWNYQGKSLKSFKE
jgi:hypothetical protein